LDIRTVNNLTKEMPYYHPKYIPIDHGELSLEIAEALAVLNVRIQAGLVDTTAPEFEELIGVVKKLGRKMNS